MEEAIVKMKETSDGFRVRKRVDGQLKWGHVLFKNYIYMDAEDYPNFEYVLRKFVDEAVDHVDRNKKVFKKLILSDNLKRNIVRKILESEGCKTYEADIVAPKRWLIDNPEIPLHQDKMRYAFYDIETDDRKPFKKNTYGDILPVFPILSVSIKEYDRENDYPTKYFYNKALDDPFFDDYKKMRMKFLENPNDKENREDMQKLEREFVDPALLRGEKVLLDEFFTYAIDFDVLSAYNANAFDDPYLRERAKLHGFDFDALMTANLDYLKSYEKNNFEPVKSYKLNNVAYQELKSEIGKEGSSLKHEDEITKVDWKERTKAKRIFDLYVCYPRILKEYNDQDVILLDMIEKKLNFFKLHQVQCEISHAMLVDTLHNSRVCDIAFLKKYKQKNIIRPSKPTNEEKEKREQKIPPGGYTYCFLPGYYEGVETYDFASFYPATQITYFISPENFIRTKMPDLSKVFSENEIEFIHRASSCAKDFLGSDGKLKNKKYDNHVEEMRISYAENFPTMDDLMWKFVEEYDCLIEHEEHETYTPADINRDARGWAVHPHVVFDNREEGVYPETLRELIVERNQVKYVLKNIPPESFEWWEKFNYQLGLKILANSAYGFTGFRGGRDYLIELPTAITTACRFTTKKSILFAKKNNLLPINGDTDSSHLLHAEGSPNKEEMNIKFFEFFDEFIKPFNTKCEIELRNPKTEEMEKHNHFIVFEHEKTMDEIAVRKKRYYYRKKRKDGTYEKVTSVGGYGKRSDVIPYAAQLQERLLEDIFAKKFDEDEWLQILTDIKEEVFGNELEEKHIVKSQAISKDISDYGKPMIDKKTGMQKTTKDGKPRFANIPANVKVAKNLIEEGEYIQAGDKIQFVVYKSKPKIEPITISEYRKKKQTKQQAYDHIYYHDAIIKPILEVLSVVNPGLVVGKYKDVWGRTKKQMENLRNKLLEDDEE